MYLIFLLLTNMSWNLFHRHTSRAASFVCIWMENMPTSGYTQISIQKVEIHFIFTIKSLEKLDEMKQFKRMKE